MNGEEKKASSGSGCGLDPATIKLLQKYNNNISGTSLADFMNEPGRFDRFSRRCAGLMLDFSRVRLDEHALAQLLKLAGDSKLAEAREQLFGGAAINCTENRPAMHMALRDADLLAASGLEDAGETAASQALMLELARDLHRGRLPARPDTPIRDIVHIGIGGSLLGTRLLYEALAKHDPAVPRCHFLGSVDAHTREALLPALDPARTVVIVVSKSFTTADTLMHARQVRGWLESALGREQADLRMFAVTEKVSRAEASGYLPGQVMYLPPWVGGRYSLWSPVSLSAAAAMGTAAFRELLDGAARMDRHFRGAEFADNLPVLMGLTGVWHRNVCGFPAWAVVPYDQRLRSLPAHLQQVVMESNGKSTTAEGTPVRHGTSPMVFGESGTEAQHSLFQALHQGTDKVPVNMVGVIRPDHEDQDAHDELLANLLAQATALAAGRAEADTRRQIEAEGGAATALLAHRSFEGDRPCEILLLDALTPENLGLLLALYEHKVFVESVVWGINAFDQWGVELGKQLAPDIRQGLKSGETSASGLGDLLRFIRNRR